MFAGRASRQAVLINGDSHINHSDNPLVKGADGCRGAGSPIGARSVQTTTCATAWPTARWRNGRSPTPTNPHRRCAATRPRAMRVPNFHRARMAATAGNTDKAAGS
jgi:hypothetical protein